MRDQDGHSEAVKASLSTGTATAATVNSLQVLLGLATTPRPPAKDVKNPGAHKGVRALSTKTRARGESRSQAVCVHHDEAPISPKARYGLATDVVNITLKMLSQESIKITRAKVSARHIDSVQNSGSPTAVQTSNGSPASQRALQSRPGNATPLKQLRDGSKDAQGSPIGDKPRSRSGASCHTVYTAECARLGLSHLRVADPLKLGLATMPALQLENATLALAASMESLGLESLATKEIYLVKRGLETIASKDAKRTKTKAELSPTEPGKETLASLLRIDVDFPTNTHLIPPAVTYHALLLRLIASSRKPAVIEACIQHLDPSMEGTPAYLIGQQARETSVMARAAKQLDTLSLTILSLCPSVASAADESALDRSMSPSPAAAFQLQTFALLIRKQWWYLINHQVDQAKELVNPYMKCLTAFVRRTQGASVQSDVYRLASSSCASLDLQRTANVSCTLFGISRVLSSLAEQSNQLADAATWAGSMLEASKVLGAGHARTATALTRLCTVAECATDERPYDHTSLQDALDGPLHGTSADYDLLLAELASLTKAIGGCNTHTRTWNLAAAFAQRYVRSYPGRSIQAAETIVLGAIRNSKTSEDLIVWAKPDAAKALIQTGRLRQVADLTATQSTQACWSSSTETLALGRVLHALMLKALRDGKSAHAIPSYDDLPMMESAMVLEWQLSYAIELSQRPKYKTVLVQILPPLLQKLAALLTVSTHPLRRANLAIVTLRLQEMCPELAIQQALGDLCDTDELQPSELAHDVGLCAYLDDINATLRLCKAFTNAEPSGASLKSSLMIWQRILNAAGTPADVRKSIYDPESLLVLLNSTASYLIAMGEEVTGLQFQLSIVRLNRLMSAPMQDQCTALVTLAKLYLQLGRCEASSDILQQAHGLLDTLNTGDAHPIAQLQVHLMHAEYTIAIDDVKGAQAFLINAKNVRGALTPGQIHKPDRRLYELLHAQGWVVQSKFCLKMGKPHDSLTSAKHAVKLLNSMWSASERTAGRRHEDSAINLVDSSTEPEVDSLTSGVSRLQLAPAAPRYESEPTRVKKGATFWTLVSLLCTALLHLSDMYAHHGIFLEADYYTQRAVDIAESVGSKIWLSRAQIHRCHLLVAADRLEEAELCLAKSHFSQFEALSLDTVELRRAQAAVRCAEGSSTEAVELYEQAETIVERMQKEHCATGVKMFQTDYGKIAMRTAALTIANEPQQLKNARKSGARSAPAKRGAAMIVTEKAPSRSRQSKRATVAQLEKENELYLYSKIKSRLAVDRSLALLHAGRYPVPSLPVFTEQAGPSPSAQKLRKLQFRSLMQRAFATMESDLSYNVLPESTICFPALATTDRKDTLGDDPSPNVRLANAGRTAKLASSTQIRNRGRKQAEEETLTSILGAARDCLLNSDCATMQFGTTAETHAMSSMLSEVTMLLSAAAPNPAKTLLQPFNEAMHIDQSRIKSFGFERRAVRCDHSHDEHQAPFSWPASPADRHDISPMTDTEYQEQYIDILPKPWTVISLFMDEQCRELYLARYRSGQSPLLVRLPFSRQKPDDDEEGPAFDFSAGKTELQDIIEASNASCHNTSDLTRKGAKTEWWSEREVLDRRLHELLINMENIWFGGFKGVFSKAKRRPDVLARFRKSFEEILTRYLPSRKTAKSRSKQLALDDKILDLFVGLGHDEDENIELDEPLADLLYFVVDILQYNGECNAYDEIDFDGMTVDVLDALRTCHETCSSDVNDDQHLILVLDKRLQLFPWESLPCLENVSVSRVGSMLSLRGRVLAMRRRENGSLDLPTSCHFVDRKSGTYILNPAGDLTHTETTLSPALSKLSTGDDSRWKPFSRQEPTEADFTTALTQSSMVLYFGHGAGSQYIRPRTIKKLDTCSEVVWLMGCSSGAVTEYGELEPFAVPLAYMLAAEGDDTIEGSKDTTKETSRNDVRGNSICMAVVATLWDVTDKDIDRFSLAIGEEWGLWPASEASKLPKRTSSKLVRTAAPSTPQQVSKTPKTPKTRKTPAPVRIPARSRSRPGRRVDEGKKSLVEAVARSRDACYLRYLNGAAPVVFGVPAYLSD